MPARRFWMMTRQIDRIRAEAEIRSVQRECLISPPQTQDQLTKVNEYVGRLTLEIGETAKLRRSIMVAPEADAKDKFMKIMGG